MIENPRSDSIHRTLQMTKLADMNCVALKCNFEKFEYHKHKMCNLWRKDMWDNK
jgi:hypothetical protein